MIPRIY